MTAEQWRNVPDSPGYEVSDMGRVRGPRGLLSTKAAAYRYPTVQIRTNGRFRVVRVHILVLETFAGPRRGPGVLGCHRDDNPHNNKLSNLYWGSTSDNIKDKQKSGKGRSPKTLLSLSAEASSRLTELAVCFSQTKSQVVSLLILRACSGIIPGTFIICGEGGNYCSEACLMRARNEPKQKPRHPKRTPGSGRQP